MVHNTTMLIVRFWIIFGLKDSIVKCLQVNKQFRREPNLDGYDCLVNEIVFKIIDVSSKTECIKICSDRQDCRSVFLANQSSSILCHGCSNNYNDTLHLGRQAEYIYFRLSENQSALDLRWNSSFYMVTTLLENLSAGQTACETWGGYIVVIETAEENNFLKEVERKIDQNLRIGLVRGLTGKGYLQASNTAPTFTDWGEGQLSRNQRCTQLWSGISYAWDECLCETPTKYLCEK